MEGRKRTVSEMLAVKEIKDVVELGGITKSKKFEQLYALGLSVSEIARVTESVYSFVYGVLDRVTDGEMRKDRPKGGHWSGIFKSDWDNGMTIGEIAKKHNKNYSYVWTVIDKHRKKG